MAVMTIKKVMARIRAATLDQPVAVFHCDEPRKLECVLYRTIRTFKRIKEDRDRFIGVYHGQHESHTESKMAVTEAYFYGSKNNRKPGPNKGPKKPKPDGGNFETTTKHRVAETPAASSYAN